MLMPFTSVLPVILLQAATAGTLRRVKGRGILWFLIAFLVLVVLVLSAVLFAQWEAGAGGTKKDLEMYCFRATSLTYMVYFAWSLAGVGVVALCVKSGLRQHPLVQRAAWWLGMLLAFMLMWVCFSWFIYVQYRGRELGTGYSERTLSFGQVLALVTWVPVIVEFAYIWWQRPVTALTGRFMVPYEAVEVSEESGAFGLSRRETV